MIINHPLLSINTRMKPTTEQQQQQPSGNVIIDVWNGIGILLAVSVISKGVEPLFDVVFQDLGVAMSVAVGFGLAIFITVVFITLTYSFTPSIRNRLTFPEYLKQLISRDQIRVAHIQLKEEMTPVSTPVYTPMQEKQSVQGRGSPPTTRTYASII